MGAKHPSAQGHDGSERSARPDAMPASVLGFMRTPVPTVQASDTLRKAIHLLRTADGRHFEAVVVSEKFQNQPRLARHRLVYEALGNKMGNDIHALSLRTLTPAEA